MARSFADTVNRFAVTTKTRLQIVTEAAAAMVYTGIVFGSEVTGAPGQPVDSRALRESWSKKQLGPFDWLISTNSPYAQSNEDGIARPGGGPYRLLSKEGGRWSVRLTVVGWPRIIDKMMRDLGGAPAR